MDLQLNTRLVLQLQEIAKMREQEISDLLLEAIERFVEAETHESEYREQVRAALHDHQWLLAELAER